MHNGQDTKGEAMQRFQTSKLNGSRSYSTSARKSTLDGSRLERFYQRLGSWLLGPRPPYSPSSESKGSYRAPLR